MTKNMFFHQLGRILSEFCQNFILVLKRYQTKILTEFCQWQNSGRILFWTLAEFWQNFVLVLKRNYK